MVGAAAERKVGQTQNIPTTPAEKAAALSRSVRRERSGAAATDEEDSQPMLAEEGPRTGLGRWVRRVALVAVILGVIVAGLWAAYGWTQQQYYVGERDGTVAIYRGLGTNIVGYELSSPYETTNLSLDQLSEVDAGNVREGIDAGSLDDAKRVVKNLADSAEPASSEQGDGSAP